MNVISCVVVVVCMLLRVSPVHCRSQNCLKLRVWTLVVVVVARYRHDMTPSQPFTT